MKDLLKRTHFIFATGLHAASYCSQLSGAFMTSKVSGIGKSQLSLLSIFIHVSKNFSVCANKCKIGMSVTMDQLNWVYLPIFCSLFLYWSNTTGCSVALCFNLWCSTDASCFNFAREWFKTFTLQIKLADKLLNCYEHCETVAVWFDLTPKLFG